MKLSELKLNESCRIVRVHGSGSLRQHFLDMGLIENATMTLIKTAPMGDPMEFEIHGYELTLRKEDAANIEVENISERIPKSSKVNFKTLHPGLGEEGKYHDHSSKPLDEGTTLNFALMGNQNCGKTTLFNRLTGSNQHVGNFPGVTVESKQGELVGYPNTTLTDLPGIYSMSPYSSEEIVSRNFVLNDDVHCIINIVDATNIERNLYLTLQLLELGKPMVVACNMMDELLNNRGSIDVNMMEKILGVPVIPISAAKNEGIEELVKHALHVARYQEKPEAYDFCAQGPLHRTMHSIMHLIDDHCERYHLPIRFAASKLLEKDELVTAQLHLDENEQHTIDHLIMQMETESGMDGPSALATMRYDFIKELAQMTVVKPKMSKEHERSLKIDRILTGKYTAIPCFLVLMLLVFFLTFNVIGASLQSLLAKGIDGLSHMVQSFLVAYEVSPVVESLVVDGIFNGVGSVLSFLPIIVVLFLFLSLMEDSGYIARVAFVMDHFLRKIGLSGRSIVPLLIGFGCSVPAVMSTRTLPSERDRRMTILLTPFMSCSAKLPILAFFSSAFFGRYATLVMMLLYVLSITLGILVALIFKKTLFKGEAVPFVMELPNYRMPSFKNTMQLLMEKARDFLQKAFSVILIATLVIWFFQTFDFKFHIVSSQEQSMLAAIGRQLAVLLAPIGLGDWRFAVSLISGFMAKESVVSTIQILFGQELFHVLTLASATSMLMFSLLYTPCVAAIAAIKRELGTKWALFVVAFQCLLAWLVAFISYQLVLWII